MPNAKSLQDLAVEVGESCIIDGWECGYVTDLAKWESNKNKLGGGGGITAAPTTCTTTTTTKTPIELLHGFFEFYATFDYEKDVVSPYAGVSVPKENFQCKTDSEAEAAKKTNQLFKPYFDRISDPGSNDPILHTNTCFCVQVSSCHMFIM